MLGRQARKQLLVYTLNTSTFLEKSCSSFYSNNHGIRDCVLRGLCVMAKNFLSLCDISLENRGTSADLREEVSYVHR